MDVADPPTDAALASRRDRAAFDQLLDRHARPLAAWLLRRLPSADAEELLPTILLRARRAGGSFRGDDYRAWLIQLARSSLAEWLRRFPRSTSTSPGDAERPPLLPAMPDDAAELPGWLERHVAGPDLTRLIAELSADRDPKADAPDLATVLGPDRAAVLVNGLGVLSESRVRTFLSQPALLAELQDAAAEASSPYWDDRFDHPTLSRTVRQARQDAFADDRPRGPQRPRSRWYLQPWFVALASAAIVLFTVVLHRPPGPPTWGLTRPGVMTKGDTPTAHLTALANAAAEWDGRPRQTPAELRRALRGMRDGVTAILAAPHHVLSNGDREWLTDKCLTWGAKLDRQLADLHAGRAVDEVRVEADDTIGEIVRDLRERAGQ